MTSRPPGVAAVSCERGWLSPRPCHPPGTFMRRLADLAVYALVFALTLWWVWFLWSVLANR